MKEEFVDHYALLGLPSGEEGAKLTEKEISKAYKLKALEIHPDKRPDDPYAHANFQKLKTSYEILKDEKARKLFDDLLRVKRDQLHRQSQQDSKRRKMVSDLEARERAAFVPDQVFEAIREEERIVRKLKEEIDRIRALNSCKGQAPSPAVPVRPNTVRAVVRLDKSKVLKVSWEFKEDYSAERLKEVFSEFGEVEDVVIKSSKKRGSALVVMSTKEAALAATGSVCGSLSNPLLVLPVQPQAAEEFLRMDAENDRLNNLVGAGFLDFERNILKKLEKVRPSV
ncbi:hypothetical protein HS088_TW15G00303 [Tripterygium wilfordii]|uniref:Uncharacterized protein n=1 Tax=Tripterygium wilfordii TaxID=458696 RepID=A0A7J7CL73_TRIWF|nr:dnaJ homolog subfamily C member 17-like [Tripterygium wilfordii]KAF5734810.1 hypothetical protein HS088_TW15G00303 [Tripterygium wilfordii]